MLRDLVWATWFLPQRPIVDFKISDLTVDVYCFRETERKLMASSVKRKVQSMMAANHTELEMRRDK